MEPLDDYVLDGMARAHAMVCDGKHRGAARQLRRIADRIEREANENDKATEKAVDSAHRPS